MKLTPDVVLNAPTFMNPINEQTISLRGLKLGEIENLEATNDTNECIDLIDNEIKVLENFPKLYKLQTLLLSNNTISLVSDSTFGKNVPNLTKLAVNMNSISSFEAVANLVKPLRHLKQLSLLDNPITAHSEYRLFVIFFASPSLEVLDFARVTNAERDAAQTKFGSDPKVVEKLLKETGGESSEQASKVNGSGWKSSDVASVATSTTTSDDRKARRAIKQLTEAEKAALKEKLMLATSVEEVQALSQQLAQGG